MFFLCRFMQPALGVFNIGVATGAGTDGIVIQGTAAGNSVTVQNYVTAANSPSGAAATRALGPIPIPPIAAGQFYDLGLEIDRTQNLFLYAGVQLVGWLPQSGTGGPFLPDGTPTTVIPTRGKVFANYNYIAQQTGLNVFLNPILFTLAPVGIYMSFAGQVDFAGIFKER
jgi:hypothetical protein